MPMLKRSILVLTNLGFFTGFLRAEDTLSSPLIPRDVLFGNPERADPQISPDGTQLGYFAPGRANSGIVDYYRPIF
jgi:hypothetical protein